MTLQEIAAALRDEAGYHSHIGHGRKRLLKLANALDAERDRIADVASHDLEDAYKSGWIRSNLDAR